MLHWSRIKTLLSQYLSKIIASSGLYERRNDCLQIHTLPKYKIQILGIYDFRTQQESLHSIMKNTKIEAEANR